MAVIERKKAYERDKAYAIRRTRTMVAKCMRTKIDRISIHKVRCLIIRLEDQTVFHFHPPSKGVESQRSVSPSSSSSKCALCRMDREHSDLHLSGNH